jgi:multidrug efflux pump subunit AcrA (membrane-fusion protein)
VDGLVTRVHVRAGERVAKGQVLVEIEDPLLETEVARLRGEHEARKQAAETVSRGAREEVRAALAAEVQAAGAEVASAEDRARRAAALNATGAVPDTDRLDSAAALRVAQAKLEEARARLSEATHGPLRSDVETARDEVLAAGAAQAQAERRAALSHIVSPIDGVVLIRRVEVGDVVTGVAGGEAPVLLEIADDARLELRIEVESTDAEAVTVGQRLEIRRPGGLVTVGRGTLIRLGARLTTRSIGVTSARERAEGWVRNVWASVDWDPGAGAAAHPIGERLEAYIALPPKPVSTSVPREAITIQDGRAVVEVAAPFGWREVPVELGASDDRTVEIAGLDGRKEVRLRP